MRGFSDQALLRMWEAVQGQPALLQALTLLGAAYPEIPRDELARLSLGQRDAWLLALRERTAGTRLDCQAECPMCRERLSFSHSTQALLGAAAAARDEEEARRLTLDGYHLRFRLPDSRDLAAAARTGDEAGARTALLSRIIEEATRDGEPVPPAALPPSVVEALEERLAACDPLLEIILRLRCPACDHAWSAPFEVLPFVLAEVSAQARRLLRDVHTLAERYHWSEEAILAMTPQRRNAYLEILAG